ncbi:unnamed protein product [Coccothraustes coccothraustes]
MAGNHDHAGNVTAQLRYSRHSPRWHFPTRTTACACTCRAPTPRRGSWCWTRFCSVATATISVPVPAPAPRGPRTRRRRRRTWAGCGRSWRRRAGDAFVLVAGHYPVWSVAKHGPTGCLLRLLRPLLRRHRVSAYLCGHDHNLQYLEEGGVAYILSGAGNFMEDSRPHERSVPPGALRFFFGSPGSPGGFAHLRLEPGGATVTFLEATGRVLHRATLPPRRL